MPGRLDAVHARHADIQQHHIGAQVDRAPQSLFAVLRLPDDFSRVDLGKQAPQPLARPQLLKIAAASPNERRTHIAARHREGLRLIPVEEVQFFFAEQKYTTVRHLKGEDLIEDSLRALEEELGNAFVRIHRNALVSVRFLERIERNTEGQYYVRLRGCEAPLQVSRRMAGELRDRFRI